VAAGEATVIAPLPTTVDSSFAGTALKTNTSAVDGDLWEEEEEVELRPVAREMRRCGGSYRGERQRQRSDRPVRDTGILWAAKWHL
jgi:hypothetical protein